MRRVGLSASAELLVLTFSTSRVHPVRHLYLSDTTFTSVFYSPHLQFFTSFLRFRNVGAKIWI